MENYYIYNGHLYSQEELLHFKLGFIKPGHKWITRERSKDDKKWIYTYTKNKAKTAGVQDFQSNKYEEMAQDLEKEIQEKYGNARSMSPAQVADLKKKQDAIAYYRSQSAKSKTKSTNIQKEISSLISKYGKEHTTSEKIKAFIQHPFNKRLREKVLNANIESVKSELTKIASETQKKVSESFKTNKLTKEERVQKEEARQTRIKTEKEEAKQQRKKAEEHAKNNPVTTKLAHNPDRVKGLNIQHSDESSADSASNTNPNYTTSGENYQEYATNCSNCSVAYDMRQRGYDVEAKGHDETEIYAAYDEITEIANLYDGDNKQMAGGKNIRYDDNTKYSSFSGKRTSGQGLYYEDELSNSILQSAKEESSVDQKYQTWTPYGTTTSKKRDASRINNKTYLDNLEKEMVKGGNGARGVFELSWCRDGYYVGGHSMAYEVRNNKVVIIDAQTNKTYEISDFYENSFDAGFLRTDNLEPNENVTKKVKNAS